MPLVQGGTYNGLKEAQLFREPFSGMHSMIQDSTDVQFKWKQFLTRIFRCVVN